MPSIRVVVVGIENPAQNDASGPRHARVQLTRYLHDLELYGAYGVSARPTEVHAMDPAQSCIRGEWARTQHNCTTAREPLRNTISRHQAHITCRAAHHSCTH